MYMGRKRKYKDWSHIPNGRRRYMAEILPIRGKLYPINHSIKYKVNYIEFLSKNYFRKIRISGEII